MSDDLVIEVEDCARCGQSHHEIYIKEFKYKKFLTHWANCPATNEPLVFRINAAKGEGEELEGQRETQN